MIFFSLLKWIIFAFLHKGSTSQVHILIGSITTLELWGHYAVKIGVNWTQAQVPFSGSDNQGGGYWRAGAHPGTQHGCEDKGMSHVLGPQRRTSWDFTWLLRMAYNDGMHTYYLWTFPFYLLDCNLQQVKPWKVKPQGRGATVHIQWNITQF